MPGQTSGSSWHNDEVPSSLAPILDSPGWELLETLQARVDAGGVDLALLNAALRKQGVAPELAAALLTQLDLRMHAVSKFADFARHMVLTRDGLEQATRLIVAARHAKRFRDGGATYVADLGCGIGSDSMAIAGLGMRVLAIDRDEDAAAAAAVNLRAFPDCTVQLGDVTDIDLADLTARGVDAIFADPARRSGRSKGGARLMDPESWSPPLSLVLSWRSAFDAIGIKLAPGIAHSVLPGDCHAQWTSVDSSLVEAALWTPPLAPEGPGRSALVIRGDEAHVLLSAEISSADAPTAHAGVGPLGAFIAEPDDAVIRAGLVKELADRFGARLISERIAYLSADEPTPSPFATWFEVLDVTALRPKAINRALRAHDVGRLEVKKRGADIDPERLRASLSLSGADEATLIATRVAGRHQAILARRVPGTPAAPGV